jgi:hypothetical protein
MKGMIGACTLLGAILTPISANSADYLAFGQDAKEVAQTVTSIKSCKRMGFDVDDSSKVPDELNDAMMRRAVMDGIDRDTAQSLVQSALKREQADLELMSSLPDYVDTKEKLIARFRETMAFWSERCASLATGELSSRYIHRSGREGDVQQQLIAATTKKIEAATTAGN